MLDLAWIALSLADHLGGKRLRALMTQFDNNPQAILDADERALQRVPGIGPKTAATIRALDPAALESALEQWQAAGVQVM